MIDDLKKLGTFAFGLVILIAVFALPAIFVMGALWAAEHLLTPLVVVGWIAIAADLLVLLLAIFKSLRPFAGSVIFISSYIFGLVSWLLGFVLTYVLWGLWAVIVGILFLGGGVVPIALLATMFKGMWEPFFTLLVLSAITFGARIGGIILASQSNH